MHDGQFPPEIGKHLGHPGRGERAVDDDAIGGAQAVGLLSVQPASIEAVCQRCAAALRGQQQVWKVAEEQHRALREPLDQRHDVRDDIAEDDVGELRAPRERTRGRGRTGNRHGRTKPAADVFGQPRAHALDGNGASAHFGNSGTGAASGTWNRTRHPRRCSWVAASS